MNASTDTPDPRTAADLLAQAERTTAGARGNAGWLQASLQLGMGAATSVYLVAARDGFDFVGFAAMMTWIVVLCGFNGYFGKVAKQGFGRRWGIFMAVWGVLWAVSMFAATPVVSVTCAVLVTAASVIAAVVEVRK